MRIFKNVDEKLKDIGFNKICEDKHGAQYERYNAKYNYWQRVDIWHKLRAVIFYSRTTET